MMNQNSKIGLLLSTFIRLYWNLSIQTQSGFWKADFYPLPDLPVQSLWL
jgi:hypothetical protein